MHLFSVSKGKRRDLEDFETIHLAKMYAYLFGDNQKASMQPNFRQVRFLTIEVHKDCEERMFASLAPFNQASEKFKRGLLALSGLFSRVFGAEPCTFHLKKGTILPFPHWRYFVNCYLLGIRRSGEKIKIFVLIEAQRKYLNEFQDYLESREYEAKVPNNPFARHKPEVKEIRFLDISTFETCMAQLYSDIAPYRALDEALPLVPRTALKIARKTFGLKKPHSNPRLGRSGRLANAVTIYTIAEKKDRWINGSEMI